VRALEIAAAHEIPGDHVWDVVVARWRLREWVPLSDV
jgi:hypothetical protein